MKIVWKVIVAIVIIPTIMGVMKIQPDFENSFVFFVGSVFGSWIMTWKIE